MSIAYLSVSACCPGKPFSFPAQIQVCCSAGLNPPLAIAKSLKRATHHTG